MNICTPCSGDFAFAKHPCMDYKYSFTDNTTCILSPQKLQCSRDLQECLTNSQKYFGTFQLFIHATKITNLWSKQHNLFLECISKLTTWESVLCCTCLSCVLIFTSLSFTQGDDSLSKYLQRVCQ